MALSCSKNISALLHKKTSSHKGDFLSLNCFYSFSTENKLKSHEEVFKNKDFCRAVIPSEKSKILKFNQYAKSEKIPYIIYTDLERLIKEVDGCKNNPDKS